jgi:uncharacterized protein (DUF1697 family)
VNTYIALFRGINVGGANRLPMKELKAVLEKAGCVNVRTYVQSGNVILDSSISAAAGLAKRLTAAVSRSHRFEPRVIVLTRGELERAAAANPFPQADRDPKSLHLFFLDARPTKSDLKPLEAKRAKTEAFALKGTVLYLYTPDGFGSSKLAASAERLLGVAATARNWRTVRALVGMTELSNEPAVGPV